MLVLLLPSLVACVILFGMWLYVVYVCACLMYLSVGCLVHQACTHVDKYSHIPNKMTQASREGSNSTSTKDDPLKMVKQL